MSKQYFRPFWLTELFIVWRNIFQVLFVIILKKHSEPKIMQRGGLMPGEKGEAAVRKVAVSLVREYKLTEKVCPVCGKTFMGTKKKVYDTVACQQKANYDRNAEKYLQQKREKYRKEKGQSGRKAHS